MQIQIAKSAGDAKRKFGDFTGLAQNYSKFRPAYSETILTMLLSLTGQPASEIAAADLGAGTGLWTRMLARRNLKGIFAVEPNDDMRKHGQADSKDFEIKWMAGSGEKTGLSSGELDLVTAASCFHWFDFDDGMKEIARLLKPGGWFVALWNPRIIQGIPLFEAIENKILELAPEVKRVSSGNSEFTKSLTSQLLGRLEFHDLIYLEGRHVHEMTPDQYIGVWRSVNDLQVQLGENRFEKFMKFVEEQIEGLEKIEAHYLTRAWAIRRR
jgi:SAM-dependent methyltransferase